MRSQALGVILAVATACVFVTGRARADYLADEADLLFQLGAEAYQRGDYREALKNFLGSNRLVPNRNVVFNVARTYEKLRQYPEAYRYFLTALDAEKDAAVRGRIEDALEQIKVHVAIVAVTHGGIVEWRQSHVPGRSAEAWDVAADLAGALAGAWLPFVSRWARASGASR